jgi:hypothetical protein
MLCVGAQALEAYKEAAQAWLDTETEYRLFAQKYDESQVCSVHDVFKLHLYAGNWTRGHAHTRGRFVSNPCALRIKACAFMCKFVRPCLHLGWRKICCG